MNNTYIANGLIQGMMGIYGGLAMDKSTCHELAIHANYMVDYNTELNNRTKEILDTAKGVES